MTTPQTPDDTAGERLVWALTAAVARSASLKALEAAREAS